jgi:hypothetical protein
MEAARMAQDSTVLKSLFMWFFSFELHGGAHQRQAHRDESQHQEGEEAQGGIHRDGRRADGRADGPGLHRFKKFVHVVFLRDKFAKFNFRPDFDGAAKFNRRAGAPRAAACAVASEAAGDFRLSASILKLAAAARIITTPPKTKKRCLFIANSLSKKKPSKESIDGPYKHWRRLKQGLLFAYF